MENWSYTFQPINISPEGNGGTEVWKHSRLGWSLDIQEGNEYVILTISLPSLLDLNNASEALSASDITHDANTSNFLGHTSHFIQVKYKPEYSATPLRALAHVIPDFNEINSLYPVAFYADETMQTATENHSSYSY